MGAELRKGEALRALGVEGDASFDEAKRAFRRQAMRWHPDRNRDEGAEERFKEIRACFEALQEIQDRGAWPIEDAESDGGHWEPFAEHGQAEGAASQQGQPETEPPAPQRERQAWDPPTGPMFDLGREGDSPEAVAEAFFESMLDIAEAMLDTGAGARMVGAAVGRGFDGFMGCMEFALAGMQSLRLLFLVEFWCRRRAELFAVLERARETVARAGWANAVVAILDPEAGIHVGDPSRFFYVYGAIARALPDGEPSPSDWAFYAECEARLPSLFARLGATERSMRRALSARGWRAGDPLIERVFERCPRLLERWAKLGTPREWGARGDWLGLALELGVSIEAVSGWIADEPLLGLCARLDKMELVQAREIAPLAEARMAAEGQWSWAGRWAGANARELGAAQRALGRVDASLRRGLIGDVGLALGVLGLTPARAAQRAMALGPVEKIAAALEEAKAAGALEEALTIEGAPLAVACAMRAFFEPEAPLDFFERAEALASVAGVSELARLDAGGRSAVDWFEMAIVRREELGEVAGGIARGEELPQN